MIELLPIGTLMVSGALLAIAGMCLLETKWVTFATALFVSIAFLLLVAVVIILMIRFNS